MADKRTRTMIVQKVSTGETAIARKAVKGLILVQMDDLNHPQAYGWHLCPRHTFKRRK